MAGLDGFAAVAAVVQSLREAGENNKTTVGSWIFRSDFANLFTRIGP
jgi:hypothetical protein